MAAIQHFLQRWGFVKLGRYGLVLTPEGRILSARPAVLDDGAGGPIVGWQDSDLAMAELQPWEPAKPAARRSAARRAATAQAAAQVTAPPRSYPPAAQTKLPPPRYQAVISEASVLAQRPQLAPEEAMAAVVAPGPTVDEDDWEWTIALARARASDDADVALSPPTPEPAPRAEPALARAEPAIVAPPRTRPIAVVATKDPATSGEWPSTEPIGTIDYEEYSLAAPRPVVAIPRVAPAAPLPVMPRAAAPITVIPVPVLPTLQSTARAGRLEPVVRTQVLPGSLRRFPKGTGTVSPRTASRMAAMPDDTELNVSVGDQTTPGVALPQAGRTVQLPSIKRRVNR
jgi:hypothetical protein